MKTRRRKGSSGPPELPPEAVRRLTIGVRLNCAERDSIQRKADSLGLAPTTWMRLAALSRTALRPLVPELNIQAYGELGRLAGNLNQLIRAAHTERANVPEPLLNDLHAAVQALRRDLLGTSHDREDS